MAVHENIIDSLDIEFCASSMQYLYTKAEILINGLRRRVVQFRIVMSASYDIQRKKLSHFDIKSWATDGTKIRPGKVGNWRIFESNWLN